MSTPPIRTLLVDDEVLARLALRQALEAHSDVMIVGECGNAAEAMQAIDALTPDLMFLDISMPGLDGFKLLHELKPGALPIVVFATAYGQHALRAYDASALDYLLKPIDQDRFDQTMTRVRMHWNSLLKAGPDIEPTPSIPVDGKWLQRMSVHVGEHIRVITTAEIDWLRADGNYVHIHTGEATYLHRETLWHLQSMLDPARFLRVHRSVIVNVERVHEVHPLFNGGAELVLKDGTHLGLSRRYRANVRRALGLP
ncbi:MAG: LytR/AlgR family response regulator transcription factor [Gammaproteobacteria bacterium]